MPTARSADEPADPAAAAAALRDAPFVQVVARTDGDSVAASGILARALRRIGVPFQIRLAPNPIPDGEADDAVTVTVGATASALALPGASTPASVLAFEVGRELGVEPDPVLGLAGVVAAESVIGADGSGTLLDAAERSGAVERRPGVAVPTADPVDGLAHSTLVHAPWSGDAEAAQTGLTDLASSSDLDEDAHHRLASLVAVDVVSTEGAVPRAAEAVERALRPYVAPRAPFETVAGFADVLDCVARERPGTAVAVALGHGADAGETASGAHADALAAWRAHARSAHRALREATTGRYDGTFVARVDGETVHDAALPTIARLLRDFRSPEPVALIVSESGDGPRAAAASVEPIGLGDAMVEAAAACDGSGYGTDATGTARFEGEEQQFITAFREAL